MKTTFVLILVSCVASVFGAASKGGGHGHGMPSDALTPVVVIPGYRQTTLEVTVHGQTVAPECPTDGTFEDFLLFGGTLSSPFSQECQDKLLTLRYNNQNPNKPVNRRFSEQEGVTVTVKNYGKTESCPLFEGLYQFLESHDYVRNTNIVVAGLDSRYNPDQKDFVGRTKDLIERTYRNNGNTPVHLLGADNGARYAQYFLTHVPQQWKNMYIHGQTILGGNFAGEGSFYALMISGFNLNGFATPTTPSNALTSATMYQSFPSTYNNIPNPLIYTGANSVTVVQTPDRSYTAEQFQELFVDAGWNVGLELANKLLNLIEFTTPVHYPNVDTYIEYGTGTTIVEGGEWPSLATGQVFTSPLLGSGDGVTSDINSASIQVWAGMSCFGFQYEENINVGHFDLIQNADVLNRLLIHLNNQKSACH